MSDLPPDPQDASERAPDAPENRAQDRAEAEEAIRQGQEALKLLDENPEVREAFAQHGFGPEKIEEGRRLLQNLIDAMKHEQEAWRRVHEAEAVQKHHEEELLRTYAVHASLAREAFKDGPEAQRGRGSEQPLPPTDSDGSDGADGPPDRSP